MPSSERLKPQPPKRIASLGFTSQRVMDSTAMVGPHSPYCTSTASSVTTTRRCDSSSVTSTSGMTPTTLAIDPLATPDPSTASAATPISPKNHPGMRCFVTMRARPPSMYCAVYSSRAGSGASSAIGERSVS